MALISFCIFNANARVIATPDSRGTRYIPFAVLRDHSLSLQGFATQATWPGAYHVGLVHGRLLSKYPVVTPLLVLPLYIPAAVILQSRVWQSSEVGFAAAVMEKIAASTLASISVAFAYLLLRRRSTEGTALLLTIAYAFATSTWSISSQALWQHAAGEMLLTVCLFALTAESAVAAPLVAGLTLGLMPCNRPPDLLLALPLAIFAMWRWRGSRAAVVTIAAVAAPSLTLVYNMRMFDHFAGGYSQFAATERLFFSGSLAQGLAGLLLSPGKGLFVFCPFFLFLATRFTRVFDESRWRFLDALLVLGIIFQLFLYALTDWRAGHCYGPRFLTDLLPALVWLLEPCVFGLGKTGRAFLWASLVWAIGVQAIGAFRYPHGHSDQVLFSSPAAVWQPANAQFVLELCGRLCDRSETSVTSSPPSSF